MKNIVARNIDGGYEEINEKNIKNAITTNREINSFNLWRQYVLERKYQYSYYRWHLFI